MIPDTARLDVLFLWLLSIAAVIAEEKLGRWAVRRNLTLAWFASMCFSLVQATIWWQVSLLADVVDPFLRWWGRCCSVAFIAFAVVEGICTAASILAAPRQDVLQIDDSNPYRSGNDLR